MFPSRSRNNSWVFLLNTFGSAQLPRKCCAREEFGTTAAVALMGPGHSSGKSPLLACAVLVQSFSGFTPWGSTTGIVPCPQASPDLGASCFIAPWHLIWRPDRDNSCSSNSGLSTINHISRQRGFLQQEMQEQLRACSQAGKG